MTDLDSQLPRVFQANLERFYARVIFPVLSKPEPPTLREITPSNSVGENLARLEAHVDAHTHNEAAKALVLALSGLFERQLRQWALYLLPTMGAEKIQKCPFRDLLDRCIEAKKMDGGRDDVAKNLNEAFCVANVVRHGDGRSSQDLRKIAPELWVYESNEYIDISTGASPDSELICIRFRDVQRYVLAGLRFWGRADPLPLAVTDPPLLTPVKILNDELTVNSAQERNSMIKVTVDKNELRSMWTRAKKAPMRIGVQFWTAAVILFFLTIPPLEPVRLWLGIEALCNWVREFQTYIAGLFALAGVWHTVKVMIAADERSEGRFKESIDLQNLPMKLKVDRARHGMSALNECGEICDRLEQARSGGSDDSLWLQALIAPKPGITSYIRDIHRIDDSLKAIAPIRDLMRGASNTAFDQMSAASSQLLDTLRQIEQITNDPPIGREAETRACGLLATFVPDYKTLARESRTIIQELEFLETQYKLDPA